MKIIKSMKFHSANHPYASFDSLGEKVTLCRDFQANQKGKWRCELHIEDDKKIIKEIIISKPKESITNFVNYIENELTDIFNELGPLKRANHQFHLLRK